MNEGYTEMISGEKNCHGCNYLRKRMFKSGQTPVYQYECYHKEYVRYIEHSAFTLFLKTPTWCEFIKINERNKKLEILLEN